MKRGCVAFTALFFSVQLGHTFFDQNNWPFCSYNMFSRIRPKQSQTYKIRLYEEAGESRLVDVWEVLPLEFFRAISVIREVFVNSNDAEKQRALAAYIIDTLNNSPWDAFDQTYASVRPQTRFVGLELLQIELDLRPHPRPLSMNGEGGPLAVGEVLFSYQAP
jgi:hypothetical protein